MTTVLAAVGGVLLFLLKVLGILLLVVLALMVLLLLIPFCADVSWEQDTLTVRPGHWHHLPGVPVPEAGADGGEQAQKRSRKRQKRQRSLPRRKSPQSRAKRQS